MSYDNDLCVSEAIRVVEDGRGGYRSANTGASINLGDFGGDSDCRGNNNGVGNHYGSSGNNDRSSHYGGGNDNRGSGGGSSESGGNNNGFTGRSNAGYNNAAGSGNNIHIFSWEEYNSRTHGYADRYPLPQKQQEFVYATAKFLTKNYKELNKLLADYGSQYILDKYGFFGTSSSEMNPDGFYTFHRNTYDETRYNMEAIKELKAATEWRAAKEPTAAGRGTNIHIISWEEYLEKAKSGVYGTHLQITASINEKKNLFSKGNSHLLKNNYEEWNKLLIEYGSLYNIDSKGNFGTANTKRYHEKMVLGTYPTYLKNDFYPENEQTTVSLNLEGIKELKAAREAQEKLAKEQDEKEAEKQKAEYITHKEAEFNVEVGIEVFQNIIQGIGIDIFGNKLIQCPNGYVQIAGGMIILSDILKEVIGLPFYIKETAEKHNQVIDELNNISPYDIRIKEYIDNKEALDQSRREMENDFNIHLHSQYQSPLNDEL